MDILKFEELVQKLDKNIYHVGRELKFDENGKLYLSNWDIFRKDMSTEDYYSPDNLAVLSSSKGNTLEDIEKLVKEIENNE